MPIKERALFECGYYASCAVQLSGSLAAVEWVVHASPEPPAMGKGNASHVVMTTRCAVVAKMAPASRARTVQTAHASHAVVCTHFQPSLFLLCSP